MKPPITVDAPQPAPEIAQPNRALLETMASITDEAARFCDLHDLQAHTITGLRLARGLFPAIQALAVRLRRDPEEDAAWLLIVVETRAAPDEAADAYSRYVRDWVRLCPPTQRPLIRLSYRVM